MTHLLVFMVAGTWLYIGPTITALFVAFKPWWYGFVSATAWIVPAAYCLYAIPTGTMAYILAAFLGIGIFWWGFAMLVTMGEDRKSSKSPDLVGQR